MMKKDIWTIARCIAVQCSPCFTKPRAAVWQPGFFCLSMHGSPACFPAAVVPLGYSLTSRNISFSFAHAPRTLPGLLEKAISFFLRRVNSHLWATSGWSLRAEWTGTGPHGNPVAAFQRPPRGRPRLLPASFAPCSSLLCSMLCCLTFGLHFSFFVLYKLLGLQIIEQLP